MNCRRVSDPLYTGFFKHYQDIRGFARLYHSLITGGRGHCGLWFWRNGRVIRLWIVISIMHGPGNILYITLSLIL
jgi:hypothetical protein